MANTGHAESKVVPRGMMMLDKDMAQTTATIRQCHDDGKQTRPHLSDYEPNGRTRVVPLRVSKHKQDGTGNSGHRRSDSKYKNALVLSCPPNEIKQDDVFSDDMSLTTNSTNTPATSDSEWEAGSSASTCLSNDSREIKHASRMLELEIAKQSVALASSSNELLQCEPCGRHMQQPRNRQDSLAGDKSCASPQDLSWITKHLAMSMQLFLIVRGIRNNDVYTGQFGDVLINYRKVMLLYHRRIHFGVQNW